MPTVHDDIYKDLTYPLLDFLIDRRLDKDAKGRYAPVLIKAIEFERFLDNTFSNVPSRLGQKWTLLKLEFEHLTEEKDPSGYKCLIKLENPNVLEELITDGVADQRTMKLRYSRKDIEDYKDYLLAGDEAAALRNRTALGAIPIIIDGHVWWGFTEKDRIKIRNRADKNYATRILLWLYGKKAPLDSGAEKTIQEFAKDGNEVREYESYRPGSSIDLDFLGKMLSEDQEEFPRKSIRAAITGLNKSYKKQWGKEPFMVHNNQVKIADH